MDSTPTTHASVLLERDVNVVEFCPQEGLTHLLAAGTYTLHEKGGNRDGTLHLFNVRQDKVLDPCEELDERTGIRSWDLNEFASCEPTDAVFDLKWAPPDHPASTQLGGDTSCALLAQAGTSGMVSMYRCSDFGIETVQEVECSQEHGLCTSVDWSHQNSGSSFLASSTSSCEIVVFDAAAQSGLVPIVSMPGAHDLETWMVAFDRWQPMLLFSGADDCAFKAWDLRLAGTDPDHAPGPALEQRSSNRRVHTAGVCCINPSPWEEHVVVTGSYDESVRVWDTRNLSRAVGVVTGELATGGGVWRLKWHPSRQGLLAAACMYGGFFLIEGASGSGELRTVNEYTGHDNSKIAYGVDWCRKEKLEPPLVATCSFYERRISLWSPGEALKL